jgi:hypothetical protein
MFPSPRVSVPSIVRPHRRTNDARVVSISSCHLSVDLALVSPTTDVLVVAEFKYEPCHRRLISSSRSFRSQYGPISIVAANGWSSSDRGSCAFGPVSIAPAGRARRSVNGSMQRR